MDDTKVSGKELHIFADASQDLSSPAISKEAIGYGDPLFSEGRKPKTTSPINQENVLTDSPR